MYKNPEDPEVVGEEEMESFVSRRTPLGSYGEKNLHFFERCEKSIQMSLVEHERKKVQSLWLA